MKQFLLALLLMAALTVSAYAQDDETDTLPGLTLVSVQTMEEILGDSATHAVVSPDGSLIAYEGNDGGRGLCVYRFADETTTCTPYETASTDDQPVLLGSPTELNWSPDSRFVALTENSLINLHESDIWLYDVENAEYINTTQDNFTGNFLTEDAGETPVDLLPIWSPDAGLYFFRHVQREDQDSHSTELYTLGAEMDGAVPNDAQPVADFSAAVMMPFTIYNTRGFSLSGAAEISPDGTRLALLMRPQNSRLSEVWIVDLSEGAITQRIPTMPISAEGLPEWVDNTGFIPEGLTWVDDNALVLNFVNFQFAFALGWLAYHIDLEADDITPIFDFASVPSEEEYYSGTPTDSGLVDYAIPRFATVTPDGEYLLYVSAPTSPFGAALEAIPVVGGERLVLHRFGEEFELVASNFSSIGSDGETVRALLSGYVFVFEADE